MDLTVDHAWMGVAFCRARLHWSHVVSSQTESAWTYTLPASLTLMVPFDLLASLAMDVYLPATPGMPAALDTTPLMIQLGLSLYLLILGLGQLLFGPLSDRIGRRPVVLGGAVLYTVASLCLAVVGDGTTFLLFRMLQAAGASAALVGMFATVRDVFGDTPQSSYVYGVLSSILAAVPALGPLLGAILSENLGWRAIFFALAAMGALSLLHAWPKWHETLRPSGKQNRQGLSTILPSRSFWIYTIGFSSAMGAFFVFFSIAPALLVTGAGYSQIEFSLAFSSVALVMIATARLARSYIARVGVRGSFVRGTVVMVAGAVLMAALADSGQAVFFTFVLPMWIVAVGIILIVSVTANGALAGLDDMAGTAVALYYAIQSLIVSGVGTLTVVVFGGDGPWPVVAYCLVMCLLNVVGVWLLAGRQGSRGAERA